MRSTLSVASRGARGSSETNIMKTTTHNVDLHYTKEELLPSLTWQRERTSTVGGIMNAGVGVYTSGPIPGPMKQHAMTR